MKIRSKIKRKLVDYSKKIGFFSNPYFIIGGAQKCGTTALYNYMSLHPDLIVPKQKEIGYFNPHVFKERSIEWYRQFFPPSYNLQNGKKTFEATPGYMFWDQSPNYIYQTLPDVRLIFLLRDPVDRAYSAWNMINGWKNDPHMHKSYDPRSFEEAVLEELGKIKTAYPICHYYLDRGKYIEQLERYYAFFPESQILVIESRELKENTQAVLNRITDFLNINQFELPDSRYHNIDIKKGQYKSAMLQETREMLEDVFKTYNDRLEKLLNKKINW